MRLIAVILTLQALGLLSNAYENVALHKPSWQSKQYLYHQGDSRTDANNAVDGLKTNLTSVGGQCVISGNDLRTATWWVNLTSILSIHHITIQYRTENEKWDPSNHYTGRFLGFYLYVSNTTYRNDGYLCFHDTRYTRATIPPVLNISCPVHGQYVIYYNERLEGVKYPADYSRHAFTELCEVEVYGCPTSGLFGPNCDLRCHTNCQEYCNIETGVCLGCKPGYVGQYCEHECSERRFGQNCEEFCGDCVDFEQCHHVNGKCQNGCERGFHGTRCTEICPIGFYDKNCKRKCSSNCLYSNRCDSKSGVCQGGCKPGWQGPLCDKDCNEKNGTNCNKRCGHCRGGAVCNHINGACQDGCAAGYKGEMCTKECDVGWYGLGCKQKCSAYCNDSGVCDHVTGSCKSGCKSGWQGVNCLEGGYSQFIRGMSQQPMVSNSQEGCDKVLNDDSGNQKDKTYDTLGSNTSRASEKDEKIEMSLQTA
ncbi:protein draper-like [Saccostrea echinata]|uniref:protein draper-like n=1 Tax=Saccostrea echinata TaxID=191078 RepID=UPI002A80FD72|nr:protein draper-like [Saccostrea echinata]